MSIYLILWFLISGFLLSFWIWTIYVLFKQKSAWKLYAEKRKLRYFSNAILDTPTLSGAIDEYSVSMFASEHSELDSRSNRKLTAIEVSLKSELSFGCALGSGGMVHVVEALDMRQEYKPAVKGWDDSYALRTNDLESSQLYLTKDRLSKLVNLMKIDKSWVVFLFVGNQGILRLDTPLPIDNPKEMDMIIKQMINVAKGLELELGEGSRILRQKSQKDKTQKVLNIDEDLLDDHIGFELEDEELVSELDLEEMAEEEDDV